MILYRISGFKSDVAVHGHSKKTKLKLEEIIQERNLCNFAQVELTLISFSLDRLEKLKSFCRIRIGASVNRFSQQILNYHRGTITPKNRWHVGYCADCRFLIASLFNSNSFWIDFFRRKNHFNTLSNINFMQALSNHFGQSAIVAFRNIAALYLRWIEFSTSPHRTNNWQLGLQTVRN